MILAFIIAIPSVHNQLKARQSRTTVITGTVRDTDTKEPLGWTSVLILELNRAATAHEDGTFHFENLPAGTYSLKTFRLGYGSLVHRVTIQHGQTLRVDLELKNTPLSTETVVVVDSSAEQTSVIKPTEVIAGKRLQQQLSRTLAETLSKETGISQRTMGPAPARPVLRGLGGDRLLILEDGGRTGDISATAPDHAVVIDPLTADRVEIIRGPAALRYGPNTLAGTINVVRGQVPSSIVHHVHGAVSVQGETVNGGLAGGGVVNIPAGEFVLRMDAGLRNASDIHTPGGVLRNTSYRNYTTSLGGSLIQSWGFAGMAGGQYESKYGIPGGFVGAHPRGVTIEVERTHAQGKLELVNPFPGLKRIESEFGFTNYYHKELESTGTVGIEFGVMTWSGEAIAHTAPWSVFTAGVIGVSGEFRNFASGGFSSTPETDERNIAAFVFQEATFSGFSLQGALRVDARTVSPLKEDPSSRIGPIVRRSFTDVSASAGGVYDLGSNLFTGLTLMRSFRAPSIEELYSEGPHLAAYSFEVGNPALQAEHGFGVEWYLRYGSDDVRGQVTLFSNSLSQYIFPRNTGLLNFRTLLPLYQFTGMNALMRGAEASTEIKLTNTLVLGGSLSFVEGTLEETDSPLPMMPPLNGRVELRYSTNTLTAGFSARWSSRQNRVDQFEQPTSGYTILDAVAQYQFGSGAFFHTFILNMENIFNTEYRVHLSRVKSIIPEPGRNIKLLYKLFF